MNSSIKRLTEKQLEMRQQITFVEFDNFKMEMVVGWKILEKGTFRYRVRGLIW